MEIHITGTPKEINEFMDLRFKGNTHITVNSPVLKDEQLTEIADAMDSWISSIGKSPRNQHYS